MDRFNAWPLGIKIAAAALVVNTVRYVLVFLRVDGLRFPSEVEGFLLAASAIATGIVLTGGGVYVAHAVAVARGHIVGRALLVFAWLALLLFTVILLAPALVLGIRSTDLRTVIAQPFDWVWATVAVTAVEVLAGASVLAHALTNTRTEPQRAPLVRSEQPLSAAPSAAPVAQPATERPQSAALPVVEVAPVRLTCEHCERAFDTPNALNAHRWRCKAKRATEATAAISLNGNH